VRQRVATWVSRARRRTPSTTCSCNYCWGRCTASGRATGATRAVQLSAPSRESEGAHARQLALNTHSRKHTETPNTTKLHASLWEALGSAGAQAPCWGVGHRLALHRLPLPRQPHSLLALTLRNVGAGIYSGDAITVYNGLIDEYKSDFRGYLAKGSLLKEIGKEKDAQRMFLQARFLAPDAAKPLVEQVASRPSAEPTPQGLNKMKGVKTVVDVITAT